MLLLAFNILSSLTGKPHQLVQTVGNPARSYDLALSIQHIDYRVLLFHVFDEMIRVFHRLRLELKCYRALREARASEQTSN